MSFNEENKSGGSLLILLSAIFFAAMSLILLFELVGTKNKLVELERRLATSRAENSLRKNGHTKESGSKKRLTSADIKRLEKEVTYWKNRFKELEDKKNLARVSFEERDEFLKFMYLADDAQRRQMMSKMGLAPSNAEFASMLSSLFGNYEAKIVQARSLMKDWFHTDRDFFCRYILGLEPGHPFSDALSFIVQEWPRDNPEGLEQALRLAQEKNSSADPAILASIYKYSSEYPDITMNWLELIKEDKQKVWAVSAISRYYAEKNADAAYAWIRTLQPENLRDKAIESFIAGLKTDDPSELLSYLDSIASEDIRFNCLASIAARIAREHPEVSREIVDKFEPGQKRDECLRNIAYNLCGKSPQEAMEWAYEIENDKIRNQCILIVSSAWMNGKERDSFENWFYSVELPETLKRQILKNYESSMSHTPVR